jgi:NAD(P)-dependent dehydrogenase (short-subunit alcohol dehydrogenase family)
VAKEVVIRMLEADNGHIVNISVYQSSMTRKGGVPYGPSRAGSEALSRIMAADLQDSSVRVNLLLPGGPTETGMLPPAAELPAGFEPIKARVMGPPIVWLASPQARDVHNERIVATEFDEWLQERFLLQRPAFFARPVSDKGSQVRTNPYLAVTHPDVRLDVGTEIRGLVNAKGCHTLRDDVVA